MRDLAFDVFIATDGCIFTGGHSAQSRVGVRRQIVNSQLFVKTAYEAAQRLEYIATKLNK